MKTKFIVSGVAIACCALTACGGTDTPASPGSTPAPASSSSSAITPTPTGASVTEADLKKAMVTAGDLGKKWEATSGGSGPVPVSPDNCPQPERSTTKLEATGRAWQGFRSESAGLTTALTAHPGTDASDFKAAYLVDLKKCTDFSVKSGKDIYVLVDSAGGPTKISGADEVLGSSVRRFYLDVKGRPLAQAIQTLVCRKGSVIVEVGYSVYSSTPAETAKWAKDFTDASELMQQQLDKVDSTITS
jgi:hypothetical protein